MARKPHFVASDAGTIDAGPYHLGAGKGAYAREAMHHDLDILLSEVPKGTPILIGSADTAGGDPHVDRMLDIVKEIAETRGKSLRVAVIRSEQSKGYLKGLMDEGRLRPLENAPHFDEAALERSTRVVGMMGVEPLQDAIGLDVDLVLAGRCSDSALFAAVPILRGIPEGLAWHAGKIVECGTLTCETYRKGTMYGELYPDHGIITPLGEGLRCTPQSVASHSLYENGDPYLHRECSGTLDLTHSVFTQHDPVSVKIVGARYIPADQYSVKLEGVELAGYQTVIIGGIRDPFIIRRFDVWIAEVKAEIAQKVTKLLGSRLAPDDWRIDVHAYGRNAVMGSREPLIDRMPHEIGLAVCLTAPTQELATKIAELSRQPLLHHPIPDWSGSITGFACLFNQAYLERGPFWRFNVHHVALPHHYRDMFRTDVVTFG
ncbi:acyclic terpene utilization AtuA family protein [Microvirga sp. VF16]|uniref:acyclic terpene utilization AtuA family protein n=1 Tax=Microvirga sp. VF16 TaxID=2807101 RepID=UPI001FEE32A2|nr:acyclic terpene utilization AtuA family protein [Microvirga sp. VF16]